MSHHRIAARSLGFSYPDGTKALDSVTFEVTHGESVAVVGANGAGKSTLIMLLNGVLLPSSGEVVVGDMPVAEKTLAHIRRTVGTVFQDPDDQLFMPTVFDDVAFGPLNLGMPEEACRARVQDCLMQVGAWHLRDRPPHHLSGGEKRRVAIAAVLAMSPGILLLDEPSSGLDPRSRRQIADLLKGFSHSKIIVSHDLDMVLDLCPRTIILHEGRIAADGLTASLFQDRALLENAGLEAPARILACPNCGWTA
jgi:cobalt/nickel transport system ATP-binding protein